MSENLLRPAFPRKTTFVFLLQKKHDNKLNQNLEQMKLQGTLFQDKTAPKKTYVRTISYRRSVSRKSSFYKKLNQKQAL